MRDIKLDIEPTSPTYEELQAALEVEKNLSQLLTNRLSTTQDLLAASEETVRELHEAIVAWESATNEIDSVPGGSPALRAAIRRQSLAITRMWGLASSPPNGASALAELAKLRAEIAEAAAMIRPWTEALPVKTKLLAALSPHSTSPAEEQS